MHDFRKSVFQSALWLKDISQNTFSWSAAKHRLFYACPRAYLIRYYIAQGGWDADASSIARRAFTEKYLQTFPAWLSGILAESFSDTLLHLRSVSPHRYRDEFFRTLKLRLSRRIFLADAFLRNREYLRDPKKLSLFEIYYRKGPLQDAGDFIAESKRTFRRFFDLLEDSALPGLILETDMLSWRLPPDFLYMRCGQIPVCLRPRLHAFDRGSVLSLQLDIQPFPGECSDGHRYDESENGLSDSLFASYAAGRCRTERLECRVFRQIGEEVLEDVFTPPPARERLIADSAAEMLRMLPVSADSLELFPCREDSGRCGCCRFQGTCACLKCAGF